MRTRLLGKFNDEGVIRGWLRTRQKQPGGNRLLLFEFVLPLSGFSFNRCSTQLPLDSACFRSVRHAGARVMRKFILATSPVRFYSSGGSISCPAANMIAPRHSPHFDLAKRQTFLPRYEDEVMRGISGKKYPIIVDSKTSL
jgi:hypothetical protein